ncbi:hypothetical protein I302_109117 [Kwoniella bestiolae CBS 10118]|uniref:Uncharacterized protein n=1 Tax=Kwoniella bestiolae CBS 10118 TaxID=1296100 RepID=A0A1B9FV18_9TREE|nr:hypothetical protein I302_08263 [Kwoniella bestiolae CBS 10118]OCF22612.1 hypothetical protein I302_08263 [Kwoniella bestiolae CBS 10118]
MSTYNPPLPPVMSRENSSEDIHVSSSGGRPMGDAADVVAHLSRSLEAGPSRLSTAASLLQTPKTTGNRRASKSVSGSRPTLIVTPAKRTQSYYTPQVKPSDSFPSSSSIPSSPVLGPNIVKRKTSIPNLVRRYTTREEEGISEVPNEDYLEPPTSTTTGSMGKGKGKEKAVESRARSTSTSIVVPQTQDLTEHSTYTFPSNSHFHSASSSGPSSLNHVPELPPSSQAWSGMPLSPPPSDQEVDSYTPPQATPAASSSTFIKSAYEVGESLLSWVKPKKHRYDGSGYRRGSDDDSEKGLIGSGSDQDDEDEGYEGRGSAESIRRPGKYWGIWTSDSNEDDQSQSNYFTLPPTPPLDQNDNAEYPQFQAALNHGGRDSFPATLPTPALSTKSLSRDNSKRNKLRKAFQSRRSDAMSNDDSRGWLTTLPNIWAGYRGGKTAEVLKELGWTVGILVGAFFVSAGLVLWLIQSMPITTLKKLPQSTTDLQLLSAEIRSYMASSDSGWWHTIGVLTFVGCWKHAWSVPGAVILNILVGSLLDPMPALFLLTIITASGSLGAYTLSRPLAPLIAVLFPKPLALVRAALAPETIPAPATAQPTAGETITPIQASSDPSQPAIGGPTEKSTVWRRLLIMRAMGFVPWSGMNVACGVVGVDWKVFWITTAAGSASWSYVTASVGHILSRLKVPTQALANSGVMNEGAVGGGESLTSLLRDPVLIAKLIFLSGLTLLPVILKRRSPNPDPSDMGDSSLSTTPRSSSSSFELTDFSSSTTNPNLDRPVLPAISALRLVDLTSPSGDGDGQSPMSPLSQSLAKFTPTPRMFDLLSFGRTVIRTGQRGLAGGVRGAERIIRGQGGN